MTYPKELRESTRLEEKTYPFCVFYSQYSNAIINQNIIGLHWHEHFEVIIMQKGTAIFHIDSQPYEVEQGDVLFVPAGGLHVGYSTCNGDIQHTAIVFNSALFNDWARDPMHLKIVAPFLEGHYRFPVWPAKQDPACIAYYSLLEQTMEEYRAKRPAYQLMIKMHLYLLFTHLARTFLPEHEARRSIERYSFNRERFKPFLHYLETNFAEKLTVEMAAKYVNLNPYHFCKMFKRLTGRTFIEYVNVCRMNEAERLLGAGNLTITEVASQVGCDNPNYFTKLFKQYKGSTPSQMRKVMQ
ncbi:MAG: AraC family transcriptional regulator [Gorillibacterium sp.]|nr:AraC family transcriptional regulator [Gorillibacterium sp.]